MLLTFGGCAGATRNNLMFSKLPGRLHFFNEMRHRLHLPDKYIRKPFHGVEKIGIFELQEMNGANGD